MDRKETLSQRQQKYALSFNEIVRFLRNNILNFIIIYLGAWIVKPVASSRGRGIFLVNHPNQVANFIKPIGVAFIANHPNGVKLCK